MHGPFLVVGNTFQQCWIKAVKLLINNKWEANSLTVCIKNPNTKDDSIHNYFRDFAAVNNLIGPKHVAYTIFPHKLYARCRTATHLFDEYNREEGLYARLRHRPHSSWGTYFRRMTHYETQSGVVNQLQNIINAINDRTSLHKAAYTILIQHPGGETIRPLGGPCLNYIAIQLTKDTRQLGMLCLYRNHDYLKKAYGNYWGLCNLTSFLAKETGLNLGPLTIISSHVYIDCLKQNLKTLITTLDAVS